jgi:hypothetical protein
MVRRMEGELACENLRTQCTCKNKWSTCGAFGWGSGVRAAPLGGAAVYRCDLGAHKIRRL